MSTADKILAVARKELGYHEGHSSGHWNNKEKYAAQVPGLAWVSAGGYPWCAVFVSWCAVKAGCADLYPRTASTDYAAGWFQQRGQWSEYPAVGAQVFYANGSNEYHTGIVERYDDTYIWAIEGNTNTNGSAEGDGVYRKRRPRRAAYVEGYGYPKFPEGIESADPRIPTPQEDDDMPYRDWSKADKKALADDLVKAILSAPVTNRAADGSKQKDRPLGQLFTIIEQRLSKQGKRSANQGRKLTELLKKVD